MQTSDRLKMLEKKYAGSTPEHILKALICSEFSGSIALVSSFGTEAGLLLSMVADIDPSLPVVFLDTQKLFPETLAYRDTLVDYFKLTNVKTYYPDFNDVQRDDPDGNLYAENSNSCCYIRKTVPLQKALKPYDAWISGRKRYHGGEREALPFLELQDGKIKLNPLAAWNAAQIKAEYDARNIPAHPLKEQGYPSVGCAPCTNKVADGGDARSGRWEGQEGKTECGIHIGEDGQFQRSP